MKRHCISIKLYLAVSLFIMQQACFPFVKSSGPPDLSYAAVANIFDDNERVALIPIWTKYSAATTTASLSENPPPNDFGSPLYMSADELKDIKDKLTKVSFGIGANEIGFGYMRDFRALFIISENGRIVWINNYSPVYHANISTQWHDALIKTFQENRYLFNQINNDLWHHLPPYHRINYSTSQREKILAFLKGVMPKDKDVSGEWKELELDKQ